MELIDVENIEWGCLKPLQPMYSAYPNPLPYPALTALYKGKPCLIDGAKRLAGKDNGTVLLDRTISINSIEEQLACWQKINRIHRDLNLLERSVLFTSSYKNLLKLPLNLQFFIAVNEPSYATMSMLDYAPQSILRIMERTLKISTPGNATFKQLLELLFDLNSREQLEEATGPEFFSLMENSGIKDAVNKLFRLRNPGLSAKNNLLKKEINACNTRLIKIEHDENFEAAHLNIKAELKTEEDIEKLSKELEILKKEGRIKTLLKLYES